MRKEVKLLLFADDTTEETPEADYLEILEELYSSQPDLTDRPLPNSDLVLLMDGSSFLDKGKR